MAENEKEYTPDLYTLVDEEGNEQTFEMIDALEENGTQYYALTPYPEELANDELVILKMDTIDGEDLLVSIDDDDEYDRIGEMFLQRINEMFDFDDEYEDEEEYEGEYEDGSDTEL